MNKKENRFYVYAHINPLSNKVFYIGRGTTNRIYSTQHRSSYWHGVVKKYGIIYRILRDNLTNDEANHYEKRYIKLFGRKEHGGTLVNLTDGGDGLCGYKPTLKAREKQSKSSKGQIRKQVDEQLLHNDYLSGMTLRELCKKYNLCIGKISRHLKKDVRQTRFHENRNKSAKKFAKGQTPWNAGLSVGVGEQNNFFGKTHSIDSKKIMSAKRSKQIQCLNNGMVYISAKDAAKRLNLLPSSITKVARGEAKQYKGHLFQYV